MSEPKKENLLKDILNQNQSDDQPLGRPGFGGLSKDNLLNDKKLNLSDKKFPGKNFDDKSAFTDRGKNKQILKGNTGSKGR